MVYKILQLCFHLEYKQSLNLILYFNNKRVFYDKFEEILTDLIQKEKRFIMLYKITVVGFSKNDCLKWIMIDFQS